jgi:hypothetical protein
MSLSTTMPTPEWQMEREADSITMISHLTQILIGLSTDHVSYCFLLNSMISPRTEIQQRQQ